MYNPKLYVKKRVNVVKLQRSQGFLRMTLMMGIFTLGISIIFTLRKAQTRGREAVMEQQRTRKSQCVVIIGAGTGGAALAASLTNSHPSLKVVVIETEKTQVYQGVTPLAHVGHRSYDLSGVGSFDPLRSPATWNVTRDAQLVMGEVTEVLTEKQVVLVKPYNTEEVRLTETAANVKSPKENHGEASNHTGWWTSSALKFDDAFRISQPTPSSESSTSISSSTRLQNGLEAFPYDVLVVASGVERTLGPLKPFIPAKSVDCFRVAVNPGTTRDSLVGTYSGNVLHIKVPPASFIALAEKERAFLPPPRRLDLTDLVGTLDTTGQQKQVRFQDEVLSTLEQLDRECVADSSTSLQYKPLFAALEGKMHYPARQHDSTFVSTANMIWRYLFYFNKLAYCRLFSITADADPIGPAPAVVNNIIKYFWRERQAQWWRGSDWDDNKFHFMTNSYVTGVDTVGCVATLYNHVHNVEVRVPYAMLLLDLPVRAAPFIRRSGLHRKDYAKEAAGAILFQQQRRDEEAQLSGNTKSTPHRWWPDKRDKLAKYFAAERIFEVESGFMDVDPETLQHRRHSNIFALGDVAGLPTVKGYGATFAQVPVVAHNVEQVLHNIRLENGTNTDEDDTLARNVNARYNGYTSFPVVMTMWRVMWPEMLYSRRTAQHGEGTAAGATVGGAKLPAAALPSLSPVVDEPLELTNNHLWDNLAWRDIRGLLNAIFYQMALYELMYFFLFTRGMWYPPSWFSVPAYSTDTGQPIKSSIIG